MTTTRHPLGLREITLLNLGGRRVRLHLWTGGGSDAPHDHRAPFIAVPLLGRFAETRYLRVGSGTAYRLIATRQRDGRARVDRDTGELGGLRVIGEHVRRPLRPYRCPLDAVHSYRPIGKGPHVSLVLLGKAVRETSTVWLTTGENA